jgi:lactam utilization protein B
MFTCNRAYDDDSTLVTRSIEGAVLYASGLMIHRVIRMISEKVVETYYGKIIP